MRFLVILTLCGCDVVERVEELDVAAPVTAVAVDVDAGDVRVELGDGEGIHVHRVTRGGVERVGADAQVLGDTLRLTGECALLAPCTVDLVITVPAGVDVDVRAGSGRVELYDVDGDARVQVGEGSLVAHGLGGGLQAQVGWGDVSASFLAAPADVVIGAGGGDVTLLLPDGRYALDLDGAAGKRISGLEHAAGGARVNVRAQAGQVYVGRG